GAGVPAGRPGGRPRRRPAVRRAGRPEDAGRSGPRPPPAARRVARGRTGRGRGGRGRAARPDRGAGLTAAMRRVARLWRRAVRLAGRLVRPPRTIRFTRDGVKFVVVALAI